MKKETKEKLDIIKVVALILFICMFVERCTESIIMLDNGLFSEYNLITGNFSENSKGGDLEHVRYYASGLAVCPDENMGCHTLELTDVEIVEKGKNADGSYNIVTKGYINLPVLRNRKVTKIFTNANPSNYCIDLVPNKNGTGFHCVEKTFENEQVKDAQEQINKTNKKSELKSQEPANICLDNYLGAVYKDGKCIFPISEKMTGRAGLEKKFSSCQIKKLYQGKITQQK